MAYSPPPTPGQIQFGYTQLYLLPADGSSLPEPLIPDASPGDLYTSPLWAPDGNSIYFAHYVPRQSAAEPADYRLERMSYPEGESEVIAHQVFALAVSADGVRIAYVTGDPVTLYNGLFVANADGTDTTQVVPPETFLAIDAVAFSPDGQNLVFSGAANGFGFPVSWHRQPVPNAFKPEAHSIPEELWRTPVEGGSVQMLTRLGDTGYRFSYSPEGDFIAFSTFSALYVMNPDGSGLTILYPEGVSGSLQWLPE
jgi:Tol biopolymer transport system component